LRYSGNWWISIKQASTASQHALYPSINPASCPGKAHRGFSSLYTAKIDPWDAAPGVLLVREAGGQVTDFKGDQWNMERSDLVFSNGRVHSSLLDLLKPESKTKRHR
jgi:hypothetical protein